MKLVVLLLVLSVIAVNAGGDDDATATILSIVPTWASSSKFSSYSDCIKSIDLNKDTCDQSSNRNSCVTAGRDYLDCSLDCLQKQTGYSAFSTCSTNCGKTAKSADSVLSTYVSSFEKCFNKLGSSLLSLSVFLLVILSLLF